MKKFAMRRVSKKRRIVLDERYLDIEKRIMEMAEEHWIPFTDIVGIEPWNADQDIIVWDDNISDIDLDKSDRLFITKVFPVQYEEDDTIWIECERLGQVGFIFGRHMEVLDTYLEDLDLLTGLEAVGGTIYPE